MPKHVRNFWIDLDVEGRGSRVGTGPRSKTGGFSLSIFQRDKGDIMRAVHIDGLAHDDGELFLRISDHNDIVRHTFTTKR